MIRLLNNRIYNFIFSLVFIISAFALPQIAWSGDGQIGDTLIDNPRTDDTSDRLVGYWDLRERDTFFQITNTSSGPVTIHLQFFNVDENCAEFNYYDTLTPRDTHVYNVANLDRNNGAPLAAPDLSGGHGIIAVSVSPQGDNDNVLTGNFRIIDNAGYEYRTNMAGEGFARGPGEGVFSINFNNIDATAFADLVVITYETDGDSDTIYPLLNVYQPTLYDQNENPVSCPPVLLGCYSDIGELGLFPGFTGFNLDVGINQAITNSKGGPSLCLGTDTVGHLELDSFFFNGNPMIQNEEGAIFIGLNNGSSTGSIDHAVATGRNVEPG